MLKQKYLSQQDFKELSQSRERAAVLLEIRRMEVRETCDEIAAFLLSNRDAIGGVRVCVMAEDGEGMLLRPKNGGPCVVVSEWIAGAVDGHRTMAALNDCAETERAMIREDLERM